MNLTRLCNAVIRSRAYDHLNVGFGCHWAPGFLRVIVIGSRPATGRVVTK